MLAKHHAALLHQERRTQPTLQIAVPLNSRTAVTAGACNDGVRISVHRMLREELHLRRPRLHDGLALVDVSLGPDSRYEGCGMMGIQWCVPIHDSHVSELQLGHVRGLSLRGDVTLNERRYRMERGHDTSECISCISALVHEVELC